ncbi:energy transducer TonB family protein [Enterovibrio norvegicus]|uniref:energy transducer TonB family protein n=1 Tax=Enterovibrio norvegicus TaxID=188144 RepID=UPI00352DD7F4
MKLFILLMSIFIAGCQSTDNSQKSTYENASEEEKKAALEQLFSGLSRENIENDSSDIDEEPDNLSDWIKMVHFKFRPHFKPTPYMRHDHVKVLVVLSDSGFIEDSQIIESTGNEKLNFMALEALEKAAPFIVINLPRNERKVAKNIVLVFSGSK